jgi:O-antigen/teichoic acid export membrane protein
MNGHFSSLIIKKIPWPLLLGGGAKFASAIFALLNTRLIVEQVGVGGFGSAQTVISLMPWFMLINLGFPNSIQNFISSNHDEKSLREARGAVLRINFVGAPIALLIGVFAASFLPRVLPNIGVLFSNTQIAIICAGFSINSISQILIQYEYGLRKLSYSLASPVIVQCMMFILLLIAKGDAGEVVTLSIVSPLVANYALLIFSSGIFKGAIYSGEFLKKLILDAKSFAILTAMGQVTLACDYIIISNVAGEEEVGIYAIVNRVFGFVITLYGASLGLLWTELSSKYSSGNRKEYKSDVVKNIFFGFLAVLIVSGLFLGCKSEILSALIGESAKPIIPNTLIVAGSLYCLVRIWADTFAVAEMIKGSASVINAYIPYQLVISVIAQYWMISLYGVVGAYIGMIISFVFTACWILPRKVWKS